ncbi:thioredoxin domain-containing protein 17 isoform X2 [Pipistrellus kuhlii]|uniref:thioredoxin domain-containing protein 17 isoform X2 n=1 Tax=Pipistrellus kuhlii TaxID=59472 RepID=UPI00174F20DC|nr:thioredoxin domain-containing protein 17 isoform X2 [Pipistrellus kuhlii]
MALRGPRSPPSPSLLGSCRHQVLGPPGSRFAPPHVGPASGQSHPKPSPGYLRFRSAFPMAPYLEVMVSGFEDFNRAVEQHKAEPVVREGLKHICEECVFIYCQVGEKPYWKDPNNDFRTNLKITAVPTLLKYGTPQKLVESECLQADLVEMLFSED